MLDIPWARAHVLGKRPLFSQNGKMISAVSIDSGLVAEDGTADRGKACSSVESLLLSEEAAVDSSGDTHFHITRSNETVLMVTKWTWWFPVLQFSRFILFVSTKSSPLKSKYPPYPKKPGGSSESCALKEGITSRYGDMPRQDVYTCSQFEQFGNLFDSTVAKLQIKAKQGNHFIQWTITAWLRRSGTQWWGWM